MRVSLDWLKEYIKFSMSEEELSAMLTMAGLEVESSEKTDSDTVIEINVTPNRPDCLSILGIAKEVSALAGLSIRFPDCEIRDDEEECGAQITISDEDLCSRYAGRLIRDVRIGESPEYIRKRLEKSGMRPINNIVDVTNYVMLEMGHPLHAFDSERISGSAIRVGRAGSGVRIKTIDGIERNMPADSLLIWDSSRPVAIAGIMGGMDSEVEAGTKNIFLESAYFLPSSVRRTSRLLGLKTEASYRFERGADIEIVDKALDRAALMISRLAGGRVSAKKDVYAAPFQSRGIKVRYDKVNKTLGLSLAGEEISAIMQRLGIRHEKGPDHLIAMPPSFRPDIAGEADVIEEAARLYGYDRIPVTVPQMKMSARRKADKHLRVEAVKEAMRTSGFTEVVNYSFMNEAMLVMLGMSGKDHRAMPVRIKNPIKAEEPFLRTMLLPSLVQNLVHNLSSGNKDIRLFELSRVFVDTGDALPVETHSLGAIFFMDKSNALWKEAAPGFYLVKGVFESMMEDLRMLDYRLEKSSEPFLHPGRSADIFVSNEKTGFIGALHPDVAAMLPLKVPEPEIIVLEVGIENMLISAPYKTAYSPVQKYPYIERDVALIVDDSLPASAITGHARAYPTELIEDAVIFDFYKGSNIPEGKKSVAFTIRYRAANRTLTDSEIEDLHNRVVGAVCEATGGSVRGV